MQGTEMLDPGTDLTGEDLVDQSVYVDLVIRSYLEIVSDLI